MVGGWGEVGLFATGVLFLLVRWCGEVYILRLHFFFALPPSSQQARGGTGQKAFFFMCVTSGGHFRFTRERKKFGSTRFDLLNGARYFIRCGTRYDVVFYVDSVFFILFQWRVHKFRAQNGNLNCWFSSGSATIFAAAPHRQGGRQRLHVLVRVQLIYLHEMCQIYAHINSRSVFVRWKSQLFERRVVSIVRKKLSRKRKFMAIFIIITKFIDMKIVIMF